MTPWEAEQALVDALVAHGLRVAQRAQDVAPPCVYVKRRGTASAETMLGSAARSILGVYWVPIRGVEDPEAVADAHAAILAATGPLAFDVVDLEESSVSVGDLSYPCWFGLVVIT